MEPRVALNVPRPHSPHTMLPPTLMPKRPAGQGMQAEVRAAPEPLVEVPRGHDVHPTEPDTGATVPVGHCRHACPPVEGLKEPAGHARQALEPAVAAKVPRGHGVHAREPVAALKVPGGQSLHVGGEVVDTVNLPTGQGAGVVDVQFSGAVAPMDEVVVPAAHARHAAATGTGLYVPLSQGVHTLDPATALKLPLPHSPHSSTPL